MHFLLLPAKQGQQARTTSSSALVIKQRVHIILKCNSIHSPTTSKIPLPSFHHHDDVPFLHSRRTVAPRTLCPSRPVKRPTRFQEWSLRTKLNSKLCPEQKSEVSFTFVTEFVTCSQFISLQESHAKVCHTSSHLSSLL